MKSKGRANRWPTGLCPPAGEASPAGDRDWVPELELLGSPFMGQQRAFFGERRVGFGDQPTGSRRDECRRRNRCGLPARFG
jgi:hypothetical protein